MRIKHVVVLVVLGCVTMISLSLAFYYRRQTVHLRSQLAAAIAMVGSTPAGSDVVPPAQEFPARAVTRGTIPAQGRAWGDASPRGKSAVLEQVPSEGAPQADPVDDAPPDSVEEPAPMVPPEAREETRVRRLEEVMVKQQAQQQIEEAWNRTTNYFESRKTQGMTQEQLAEYNRMMTLLNETWMLKQSSKGRTRAGDRRDAAYAVESNLTVLAVMLENERTQEYRQLALAMGKSEQEATEFAGYINQIASNTSLRAIFPDISGRGSAVRGKAIRDFNSRGSRGLIEH